MADRDAPAPAAPLGLAADLVEIEHRGVEREVEVQVDVEVALLGEVEDAGDLAVAVAIDVGRAADEVGAEVEGLDQDGVAAGVVEQTLLGKDADLEVDRPGVVALQRCSARRLVRPTRGSTSTWVRMRLVPWTMAISSVRRARP